MAWKPSYKNPVGAKELITAACRPEGKKKTPVASIGTATLTSLAIYRNGWSILDHKEGTPNA